jgi:hypothetical protein
MPLKLLAILNPDNTEANITHQYGHSARAAVPLPQSLAATVVLPLTSVSYWISSLGNWQTACHNIGFSDAKAFFRQKRSRKWGHAVVRGWATLLLVPN